MTQVSFDILREIPHKYSKHNNNIKYYEVNNNDCKTCILLRYKATASRSLVQTFQVPNPFPSFPTRKYPTLKGALSCLRQLFLTDISLEMMKNVFYFTLKALFFLKLFNFLSLLFRHVRNNLIGKIKLISLFMN